MYGLLSSRWPEDPAPLILKGSDTIEPLLGVLEPSIFAAFREDEAAGTVSDCLTPELLPDGFLPSEDFCALIPVPECFLASVPMPDDLEPSAGKASDRDPSLMPAGVLEPSGEPSAAAGIWSRFVHCDERKVFVLGPTPEFAVVNVVATGELSIEPIVDAMSDVIADSASMLGVEKAGTETPFWCGLNDVGTSLT
jgi:hypothetical protein